MKESSKNKAVIAWIAFGGLIALGVSLMIVQEIPSMRRELRIMRM
jgi:hypothetical protein